MHLHGFAVAIVVAFTPVAAFAADIPPYVAAAVADPGRPAADIARDAERHPAETIAFAGVKPGDRVIEMVPGGGYFTRILSKVVGPTGNVYALMPAEIVTARPTAADGARAIAADPQYSNVSVLVEPADAMNLPRAVDMVWTTQNYHDLHLAKFFPNLDMLAYNKAVFAALKPGGIYFISDHEAEPGSGLRDTQLHRVDADIVKQEVQSAGFHFDGESSALRNPGDDHTLVVFDPKIRAHTDQFIFRFRRPTH